MASMPFTGRAYGGFARIDGIVRLEGDILELEYLIKDCFIGLIKSGVKDLPIPLDEIESIRFKRSVFNGRLSIRLRTMRMASQIPGADQAEVKLQIVRVNFEVAQSIVSEIDAALSEHRLRQLTEQSRRMQLPAEGESGSRGANE